MAGTVTVTEYNTGSVRKVKFAWVSDAAGAADGATTRVYGGRVIYAIQIPDGGGTQPTNLYDVTVVDGDSIDVLKGLGADLSNAANTYKADSDGLGAVGGEALTLHVTNAGNAKGGKTILFIR